MSREPFNPMLVAVAVALAGCAAGKVSPYGFAGSGAEAAVGSGSSDDQQPNGSLGGLTNSGSSSTGESDASNNPTMSNQDAPDPNCEDGVHTTASGIVYDPALADPLYNVTVYVPQSATLPQFASGASCNTCGTLYPPVVASTVTDATGAFTLKNVPPGSNVPLVVQTGKWRKEYTLPTVVKCIDNKVPDKTLRMPKNEIQGDGTLPDIAISTGSSDSLECLLLRIGVDSDEWTPGPAGPGHIHIFHGNGATTNPPAPESYQSLWDSTADLMKYDVAIFSCEGAETGNLTDAGRQSLLDYSNAGGRVFASHYHYALFNTGPFAALNLATWYPGNNAIDPNDVMSFPGQIYTTVLNGQPFPEGTALAQWLGLVNALDPNGELDIFYGRHNADILAPVGPMGTPSQPWILLDKSVMSDAPFGVPVANGAQYFSVDTPAAQSQKCGRVVYSDLHVSGGPGASEQGVPYFTTDYPNYVAPRRGRGGGAVTGYTVPDDCAMHPLTPQEKALEFMIFDLSSCLIPIGQAASPATNPR
jgi:hypothetical protein